MTPLILLLLLALGAQYPAPRPQEVLSVYFRVASEYRAGSRERALFAIRGWRPTEIRTGIGALRGEADHMRATVLEEGLVVQAPVEIDVRTVEAAALMHVEAGLLELQALDRAGAESQFSAATSLVEWSHELKAQRQRLLEKVRRIKVAEGAPDRVVPDGLKRALSIDLKIDPREFYVALAAATLALGFPEAALSFAERAKAAAPLDGEVLLVGACVKESLALTEKVRTRDAAAHRLRGEAEALFREALAADPSQVEARLRLGGVLLDEGRPGEAEPLLRQAAAQARDDRQRYLALLLLGRASELQQKPANGETFYRQALAAWPESQAARLGLARGLEGSAGLSAAQPLVIASLLDSRKEGRTPDPWWSYSFGPRGLAKVVMERLWQSTLGRSFAS